MTTPPAGYPVGPNGEIRPKDPTRRAAIVMKLATGEITEDEVIDHPIMKADIEDYLAGTEDVEVEAEDISLN